MPRSKEEDIRINGLVDLANSGDDKAMAELIAIVTPSAKAKASRLNSGYSRVSNEDLVQEGMFGFLDAVKSYDSSNGSSFVSYASICIENRIISALRKISNSGNAALSSAVSFDDDMVLKTGDPTTDIDSKHAAQKLMQEAESILSDKELSVLKLRLEGASYAEMSEKLGCTEKSIDNTVQRIKRKMSTVLRP